MSVYHKQSQWLYVLLVALFLATASADLPVVLDNLAGTAIVSPVLAGDDVSITGGG
ncbi:MAG: hypothetical protein R3C14_10345 [Caldilineaceae bacterium]